MFPLFIYIHNMSFLLPTVFLFIFKYKKYSIVRNKLNYIFLSYRDNKRKFRLIYFSEHYYWFISNNYCCMAQNYHVLADLLRFFH